MFTAFFRDDDPELVLRINLHMGRPPLRDIDADVVEQSGIIEILSSQEPEVNEDDAVLDVSSPPVVDTVAEVRYVLLDDGRRVETRDHWASTGEWDDELHLDAVEDAPPRHVYAVDKDDPIRVVYWPDVRQIVPAVTEGQVLDGVVWHAVLRLAGGWDLRELSVDEFQSWEDAPPIDAESEDDGPPPIPRLDIIPPMNATLAEQDLARYYDRLLRDMPPDDPLPLGDDPRALFDARRLPVNADKLRREMQVFISRATAASERRK